MVIGEAGALCRPDCDAGRSLAQLRWEAKGTTVRALCISGGQENYTAARAQQVRTYPYSIWG